MLFSGTSVVTGRAKAIVIAISSKTEIKYVPLREKEKQSNNKELEKSQKQVQELKEQLSKYKEQEIEKSLQNQQRK